ncbi:MAG: DUF554 domain-containing protein [Ruminococcaceae bacterium]|nr:DUF554 domain-containing protein [Oscillospiraceae bacterium]
MGFIVDACSISLGGILGGIFKNKVHIGNFSALSIGIMLISIVGILENILSISDGKIVGEHTVVVSIALIVGYFIGDALKMEDRICGLSRGQNAAANGLIDSILFFGIGGLQISGPILYALEGDSFQLILKGVIDFPFALILGAAYGKKVSLSAAAVFFVQLIIAALAFCFERFLSANLLCQICSLGYLILFFSGFNMICSPQNKIKNMNFIPGIFLIIIYNVIAEGIIQ